jgi:hypothetical protein
VDQDRADGKDHLPSPSRISAFSIHLRNQGGQESIHSSSNDSSSAEKDEARQVLRFSVVSSDKVRSTRDICRFCHSLEETTDDELFPALAETASDHCNTCLGR